MKKPTMRIQKVTPNQAKQWLEKNTCNRHVSTVAVAGYLDEMRAGRWVLRGDAIMFNSEGELINGQHRLTAVVQYGRDCEFLVMEDAEDGAKEITDQGRHRSVPDMLKMIYGVNRASMITGTIRVLDDFILGQRHKLTVGHALDMINHYDIAFKWAADSVPGKSTYATSTIVAALVFAYKTNPTVVDLFSRKLFVGADLSQTSPILVVRNQLSRMGSFNYRDQKREAFLVVLHAIYKHMKNQSVSSKSIRQREDLIDFFKLAYESKAARAAVG